MPLSPSSGSTAVMLPQLPEDHPAQAFAALSIRDLLKHLQAASNRRTHPETQIIFTAFYLRYFPYLVTVVSNSLGFVYDRDAIQEIVDDTMAAFFRTIRNFKLNLATDEAGRDQLVRSYLGRYAKWRVKSVGSFQKSLGADVLDFPEIDKRLNEFALEGVPEWAQKEPLSDTDPRVQAVAAWIRSLRPVEQDVLRTYFLDDHSGQKSSRLPDGIAQKLAKKYRTTTSNLRHLKRKVSREMEEKFNYLCHDNEK